MATTNAPSAPQTSQAGIFARTLILSVTLPLELTNRNDGQGHSWHRTAGDRQSIERLLIFERLKRTPFEHSVTLCLTRILGKGQRFWDADSGLRGNSKQLIDSLVAVGWFHDDSVKWIEEVRFFQDASQKKNGPAVLVEVKLPPYPCDE